MPNPVADAARVSNYQIKRLPGSKLICLVLTLLLGLYSPLATAYKLNPDLLAGRAVDDYAISSDNQWVVYVADQDTDGTFELYSVPMDASSAAVKLNAVMVSGGNIFQMVILPDSSRVIYLADQDVNNRREIYSVAIDGSGTAAKLSAVQPIGSSILEFQLSFDGNRVVYLADQDIDGVSELYSVAADGSSAVVKLNPALAVGRDVLNYSISPDSQRVVYVADQNSDEVFALFSVPIDASAAAVRLSKVLVAGGDVQSDFLISPDSVTVTYRADQDIDGVNEIYSSLINGNIKGVKLNPALVAGKSVFDLKISADSQRVIYRGDQDTDGVIELYSAPTNGATAAVRLNPAFAAFGDVNAGYQISSDSQQVVFRADVDAIDAKDLYSVPIAGGTALKLNPALLVGGTTKNLLISPDSARVAYHADHDTIDVFELYSVPIDGSQMAVKLNLALVSGGDVMGDYLYSPDSQTVIFESDLNIDEQKELFAVSSDGSMEAVQLNDILIADADVLSGISSIHGYDISPNGRYVIYMADQDIDEVVELFAVDLLAGDCSFIVIQAAGIAGSVAVACL